MRSELTISLVLLVVLCTVVTACGPAPSPETIVQTMEVVRTIEVEKEVEVIKTVEVEKEVEVVTTVEVEKEVVVTPTPTPLPNKTGQDTVRFQIGGSHLSFSSPFHVKYWKSQLFNHLLWEPLAYPAEGNVPVLRLAKEYEANEDATVHTFVLHDDAKWTDGEPVSAEDVAWTYQMVLDPDTLSPQQASLKGILGAQAFIDGEAEDVAGIKVIDDKTIQFELEQPDATFILKATIPVAPKHVWQEFSMEDIGQGIAPEQQKPTVTSGPFKFVTYEEAQYMQIERWDDYWGEPAQIGSIFGVHVDWGTVLAQLEAGEIDFTYVLDPGDAERLESIPYIDVYRVPSPNYCGLKVNTERLPDPMVRQALAYAIDFEAIGMASHSGFVTPVYSPMTGPDWAINPDLTTYDYDPDKAKAMLEEAGWDFDRELELMVVSGMGPWSLALQVVQQQLADIGVNSGIKIVSGAARQPTWDNGELDIEYWCGGEVNADPALVSPYWASGGSEATDTRYANPQLDDLFAMGAATSDQEKRQEIYFQAQKILNEDLPFIWMYSPNSVFAVNTGLGGFVPDLSYTYITASAPEWYWK